MLFYVKSFQITSPAKILYTKKGDPPNTKPSREGRASWGYRSISQFGKYNGSLSRPWLTWCSLHGEGNAFHEESSLHKVEASDEGADMV